MSICTPRAWPSSGRNSEYGKLEPTISSVSQPFISSQLGSRAEQADRAGDERQVVGHDGPAEQRLRDAGAEPVARPRAPRRPRRARPGPTRIATFSPALRIVGRAAEVDVVGNDARRRVADARVDGAVRARRLARPRSAARSFGTIRHVTVRCESAIRIARSIRCRSCSGTVAIWTYSRATSLNSVTQVDLLLVVAADRGARLLADDRDDRLLVELRVVEAVQEVDRARAGGREADADLAGELRVARRP